jgi:hypothetical protein
MTATSRFGFEIIRGAFSLCVLMWLLQDVRTPSSPMLHVTAHMSKIFSLVGNIFTAKIYFFYLLAWLQQDWCLHADEVSAARLLIAASFFGICSL